jgi:hypothetical protein
MAFSAGGDGDGDRLSFQRLFAHVVCGSQRLPMSLSPNLQSRCAAHSITSSVMESTPGGTSTQPRSACSSSRDVFTRSELKRPLLVPGEFGAITSGMQHARNSSSELNLLRYN